MWRMLRSNRDLRALFLAQVVSFCGDWFAYVAFVGLIQDLTGLALAVSLVYVAQTLPAFFTAAAAGAAADRFDRRRIIMVVSSGQALAALGLLLVRSAGTLWLGFACLCVISALGAFVGPAAQAGIPNLVRSDEELKQASVLFGSLWGAMLAIGAALGGVFAAAFGRDAAFVANAVSFGLALVAVSFIATPMQEHATGGERPPIRPLADMREAFVTARHDSVILALLASKATFAMGSGIVGVLAVLARRRLGAGDDGVGLLLGARGLGVALGPVVGARFVGTDLRRLVNLCGSAALGFGLAYLALSVAPTLAVAAGIVFVAHLGGGAQWTLSTYGLQRRVPDAIRGRVLAGDAAIVMLVLTLSNLAAGVAVGVIGPRPAVALFAMIGIGASVTYLFLARRVRFR
jgi:MFS family permease